MKVQGPQCVVLVPTRELGVQIAMLVYKLFGGSVNPGIPGQAANMFRYAGPKGLKVSRHHHDLVQDSTARPLRHLAAHLPFVHHLWLVPCPFCHNTSHRMSFTQAAQISKLCQDFLEPPLPGEACWTMKKQRRRTTQALQCTVCDEHILQLIFTSLTGARRGRW